MSTLDPGARACARRAVDNGAVVIAKQTATTRRSRCTSRVRAGSDHDPRTTGLGALRLAGHRPRDRHRDGRRDRGGARRPGGLPHVQRRAAPADARGARASPRTSRRARARCRHRRGIRRSRVRGRNAQGRDHHRDPPGRGQPGRPWRSKRLMALLYRTGIRTVGPRRGRSRRSSRSRARTRRVSPRPVRAGGPDGRHRRRRRPRRARSTRAERAFGDWQRRRAGAAVPPRTRAARRQRLVIPMMNKAQADIAYGFRPSRGATPTTTPHADEQRPRPVRLGGRLGDSIRERQGMAYYVFSASTRTWSRDRS